MSLNYNGLVKDVSNIMVKDYKNYLDNFEPDDDYDTPDTPRDFADDGYLSEAIERVLISKRAFWCVIEEHCTNPDDVMFGYAPRCDGDTPYDIFYNQCLNEFVTRVKRLNRKPSGNY